MMKVLQINAVYNLSSTGRTTTELHYALLEKGFDSYVAYATTNIPDDKNLFVIGSEKDRKKHALLSRLSGKQAYFSHKPTKKLIEFMDLIKPDIVNLRNLHGNYINLPMLLKYLAENDIATVVTLHDFFFLTGKCVHFTVSGCDRWQTCCHDCPDLQNGNPVWFFDRTKDMFNDKKALFGSVPRLAFVGVSKWVGQQAKKSAIAQQAKITTSIYNWIDFSKFHPVETDGVREKFGIKDKFVILGVSSSWEERKGLKGFIELSEKIGPDEVILLIGNIPSGTVLPDNIISIGRTNSVDELVAYYNCADVFLTLSLEETFGKVSAEAISCGTPVICFNSTANPELVGERCGCVVDKNDFDGIINAIEEIKNNGKEYYSDCCVEYAHDNFDKEKNIEKYIELYNQLLET